jgi:hypothetical protein
MSKIPLGSHRTNINIIWLDMFGRYLLYSFGAQMLLAFMLGVMSLKCSSCLTLQGKSNFPVALGRASSVHSHRRVCPLRFASGRPFGTAGLRAKR